MIFDFYFKHILMQQTVSNCCLLSPVRWVVFGLRDPRLPHPRQTLLPFWRYQMRSIPSDQPKSVVSFLLCSKNHIFRISVITGVFMTPGGFNSCHNSHHFARSAVVWVSVLKIFSAELSAFPSVTWNYAALGLWGWNMHLLMGCNHLKQSSVLQQ